MGDATIYLHCTNLGANNNKWYDAEYDKQNQTITCSYGRLTEAGKKGGQSTVYPVSAGLKKIKDKIKGKRGKPPYHIVDIEGDASLFESVAPIEIREIIERQQEKLAEIQQTTAPSLPASTTALTKNTTKLRTGEIVSVQPQVVSIVETLARAAGQNIKSSFSGNVERTKQYHIDKAYNILTDLSSARSINDTSAANEGIEQFMNTIPLALPWRRASDYTMSDVREWFFNQVDDRKIDDLLDQLQQQIITQAKLVSVTHSTTALHKLEGTVLYMLNAGEHEYDLIYNMITEKDKNIANRVDKIYLTEIPNDMDHWSSSSRGKERSGSVDNWRGVELQFHGTRTANVIHILNGNAGGLRVPKNHGHVANGARFGFGIYTSDTPTRSVQYTGAPYGNYPDVLFGCYVALGRTWQSSGQDSRMTEAKPGFDSTWGIGEWARNGHEYIVYERGQCSIRYMITLK